MAVAGTIAVLFFVLFMGLGTWQVQRRAWKLDLIARVEQRVHAPATSAPGPAQWPNVTAASDEYRHVTVTGTFLDASQTLVQAVTDLGAGYWVLTPLRVADGSIVLVNRGFVPADDRNRVQPGSPASVPTSTITGLLRITEPHGAFLRHNDAGANNWYSRDVQAIAAARGLTHVAPYFIDAEGPPHGVPPDVDGLPPAAESRPPPDETHQPLPGETHQPLAGTSAAPAHTARAPATPAPAATAPAIARGSEPTAVLPAPGLTVIHFHNSHLVYAITWYTLALMTAIAITLGLRKQ